jgi:hypothetical protein
LALILIDKQNLILPPAERVQPVSKVALIERAFAVLEDLLGSGLPQLNHGLTLQVSRLDFR